MSIAYRLLNNQFKQTKNSSSSSQLTVAA